MSNFLEYGDKVVFHPGYYVKELVDEYGITQDDFAKRLGTTAKNLSVIINGDQSISVDIAMKLSRLLGTSVNYWFNLQNAYDEVVANQKSDKELDRERLVYKQMSYDYFRQNFDLPNLPRKIDEQIVQVRKFLKISSLFSLCNQKMVVNYRSVGNGISERNMIRANTMVQIAINETLDNDVPKFNMVLFDKAVEYALTLTNEHQKFYPLLKKKFAKAGVVFVILPNYQGSKVNGATKKVGKNIMLMVNDRRLNADTFWFTLFHEIGHIKNRDYGISYERESGEKEKKADEYAENSLIPMSYYREFIKNGQFDKQSIIVFAKKINRHPGIVLGRLQSDEYVKYSDWRLKSLRCKYRVNV